MNLRKTNYHISFRQHLQSSQDWPQLFNLVWKTVQAIDGAKTAYPVSAKIEFQKIWF